MSEDIKSLRVPPELAKELSDIRNADTTKLAYIGDAVYEVFVRMNSALVCGRHAADMNKNSVRYVKADSQAAAAKGLMAPRRSEERDDHAEAETAGDAGGTESQGSPFYTAEEILLFKRARNRTNTSHPRGSTPAEYKLATGFEAVIGWLYIKGDLDRLSETATEAMRIIDGEK